MNFIIKQDEEYIKLGQLLKVCNLVSSGAEAKIKIKDGLISLNDEFCTMRGKKIFRGDKIKYKDIEVNVI